MTNRSSKTTMSELQPRYEDSAYGTAPVSPATRSLFDGGEFNWPSHLSSLSVSTVNPCNATPMTSIPDNHDIISHATTVDRSPYETYEDPNPDGVLFTNQAEFDKYPVDRYSDGSLSMSALDSPPFFCLESGCRQTGPYKNKSDFK